MSADINALPNRIHLHSKRGLVLVAEVHPHIPPGMLGQTLAHWKRRNRELERPVNMLFEPFGVYFHAFGVPVAWKDNEPVLYIGFGDSGDPDEKPEDLMVGGTRFLMRLAGWSEVENKRLLGHAQDWFREVGGSPDNYLPNCPGTMGIAREWIKALLRDPVEVRIERGLGIEVKDASKSPVRAPVSDAPEQPGSGEGCVDDSGSEDR